MMTRAFAAVLALCASAGWVVGEPAPAASPPFIEGASAVCGGVWLSGGELHVAATGSLIWSEASDAVTALACQGGGEPMVAVGAARGVRGEGRIVILKPGAVVEAPWGYVGEIAVRGVPSRLALENGRLAVVLETRRRTSFGIVDAKDGAKLQTVVLAQSPAGLGVSPDGESFVLAAGSDLRTFRVDDGRTRAIVPFSEPIVAIASEKGVGRMLVGQGSAVVAVDPRDKPERGSLPVRARADLPRPAKGLVWMDGGRAAGVLTADPGMLLVLAGNDLSILEVHDQEADAIGPAGVSQLRWVRGDKEKTTGIVRLSQPPPELAPYEPASAPPTEPAAELPVTPPPVIPAPLPPIGKTSGTSAEPPAAKPEPPPAAKGVPPPVVPPPAGAESAAKSEPPTAAKSEPQTAPKSEPPTTAKSELPGAVKSEPPTAAKPVPPPVVVPPPAGAEPSAAKSEPQTAPKSEPPSTTKSEPPGAAKSEPPTAAKPVPPPVVVPTPVVVSPPAGAEPSAAKSELPATTKSEPQTAPKSEPPTPATAVPPPPPPGAEPSAVKTEPPAIVAAKPPSLPPQNMPEPKTPPPATPQPGASPSPSVAPVPAPERIPAPGPTGEGPPQGRSISGRFTGRAGLVQEVVVLGPDSLLKQFARVKVTTVEGGASFTINNLPPGRYVVTPMGAQGASLSTRPSAARIVVTDEAGARADFEILGAL